MCLLPREAGLTRELRQAAGDVKASGSVFKNCTSQHLSNDVGTYGESSLETRKLSSKQRVIPENTFQDGRGTEC